MNDDLVKLIEENNDLLHENIKLTKENSKRIRKMQGVLKFNAVAKFIYYLLLIAITAGAFYTVKPFVMNAFDKFEDVTGTISSTRDLITNQVKKF